jgi:hypothetical protein
MQTWKSFPTTSNLLGFCFAILVLSIPCRHALAQVRVPLHGEEARKPNEVKPRPIKLSRLQGVPSVDQNRPTPAVQFASGRSEFKAEPYVVLASSRQDSPKSSPVVHADAEEIHPQTVATIVRPAVPIQIPNHNLAQPSHAEPSALQKSRSLLIPELASVTPSSPTTPPPTPAPTRVRIPARTLVQAPVKTREETPAPTRVSTPARTLAETPLESPVPTHAANPSSAVERTSVPTVAQTNPPNAPLVSRVSPRSDRGSYPPEFGRQGFCRKGLTQDICIDPPIIHCPWPDAPENSYYFHPYQYADIARQQAFAPSTRMSNPYDNRFFSEIQAHQRRAKSSEQKD